MRSNILPYYLWYGILKEESCSNLDDDQKPNGDTNAVAGEAEESKEKVPDNSESEEADPRLGGSQGNNEQRPSMSAWIMKLVAALKDVKRTTKMPMNVPRLRFAPP